jgi:hypothetical protein
LQSASSFNYNLATTSFPPHSGLELPSALHDSQPALQHSSSGDHEILKYLLELDNWHGIDSSQNEGKPKNYSFCLELEIMMLKMTSLYMSGIHSTCLHNRSNCAARNNLSAGKPSSRNRILHLTSTPNIIFCKIIQPILALCTILLQQHISN